MKPVHNFLLNFNYRKALLILFLVSAFSSYAQTEKIYSSLDYINEQFKKYNPYKLQFQLDIEGKKLISRSVYFEVSYDITQLSTIYFTKRGDKDCVVFFKCKNDDQCISSVNLSDNNIDLKSEYSFNLETNPEIVEKVVAEFIAIKNGLINIDKMEINSNVETNSELNSDLEYINKMLKKYNSYNVQFSINWNQKLLQSRSTLFELTYDPATLSNIELISRDVNDYKINFTCKQDENCLTSLSLRDQKTELKNNYPVNFTGNVDEAKKLINSFNHIIQNLR
jgi:hypothetical protein